MIENPTVGQRVWSAATVKRGAGEVCTPRPATGDCVAWVRFASGTALLHRSDLYDSPASAAAALRSEAQRLMDAADKLESEASDGAVA